MTRKGQLTKEWKNADLMFQQMYGFELGRLHESKPRLGSAVQVEMTMSDSLTQPETLIDERGRAQFKLSGKMEWKPPTMARLAFHFGYMNWIIENIAQLVREGGANVQAIIHPRIYKATYRDSILKFERQMVKPLRKELSKNGLYFYCVPSIHVETELTTGKPLIAEGDRVLCLLPVSVERALQYGASEEEIAFLAPQVIWLIKILCGTRVIHTEEKFIEALNGWTPYLNPFVLIQVQKALELSNPQLITSRSLQKLLPS